MRLDFHEALTRCFAEPEINGVQIELHNYGLIAGAARAFYGSMLVKDLASLYVDRGFGPSRFAHFNRPR